jgi:hypothetical protein
MPCFVDFLVLPTTQVLLDVKPSQSAGKGGEGKRKRGNSKFKTVASTLPIE